MTSQKIQIIALENLIFDLFNPRQAPQLSQREALATIAHEQGIKLVNLAEDIVEKGLNPSELPLVTTADKNGMHTIVEGNRRIAAIKLVSSPSLLTSIGLPKNLNERYKKLSQSSGSSLPREMSCAVLPNEEANHWILLKHTGENAGVGVVPWDGRAKQRFRGLSPALQAIQMVEEGNLIDDETRKVLEKISITNVERILGTPEARKELGVDVKNRQLIITGSEEETLGRLTLVISDIANKRVKVTALDSKPQRVTYAQAIARQPLPQPVNSKISSSSITSQKPEATNNSIIAKPTPGKKIKTDRTTLIPKSLRLTIKQTRINYIYNELQKLNVNDFTNCCAVMFRVFIELSIDHYAQQKTISLKTQPKGKSGSPPPPQKDMTLREKINAVVGYMENGHVLTKHQLQGIRSLHANRYHVLSVDSMNAYVHNKEYHPIATDLRSNWDSIQVFVQGLWEA
jgi:hypothetical protein